MSRKSICTRLGIVAFSIILAIFALVLARSCSDSRESSQKPSQEIEEGTYVPSGVIEWSETHNHWILVEEFEESKAELAIINPPREIKMAMCKKCRFEAELVVRVLPMRIYPPRSEVLKKLSIKKLDCDHCAKEASQESQADVVRKIFENPDPVEVSGIASWNGSSWVLDSEEYPQIQFILTNPPNTMSDAVCKNCKFQAKMRLKAMLASGEVGFLATFFHVVEVLNLEKIQSQNHQY